MKQFAFTPSAITCKGKTFPAEYSITPQKSVFVFVQAGEKADEKTRIRFNPDHEEYAAAYAAALEARAAAKVARAAAEGEKPVTIPADSTAIVTAAGNVVAVERHIDATKPEASSERPETISADEAPATVPAAPLEALAAPAVADEKATRGPVPEKNFIGDCIQGKGWKILFDGQASRTRVMFDGTPTDTARAALDAAGFYFSSAMNSWNKKLTFKAYRAAKLLSGTLSALYA